MAALTCGLAQTWRDHQYEAKGVAGGGACPRTKHNNWLQLNASEIDPGALTS
jgi:hypothetical protein